MHQSTLVLVLAAAAMAQTPLPPSSQPTASVSGTVRDAGTGAPLPDISVFYRSIEVITDDQGRYKLQNLPIGQVRLTAMGKSRRRGVGSLVTKLVTLSAGQELAGIDLLI